MGLELLKGCRLSPEDQIMVVSPEREGYGISGLGHHHDSLVSLCIRQQEGEAFALGSCHKVKRESRPEGR